MAPGPQEKAEGNGTVRLRVARAPVWRHSVPAPHTRSKQRHSHGVMRCPAACCRLRSPADNGRTYPWIAYVCIARRQGTWQSRLEVLAAARQKAEREQQRLAAAAERRHREQMARNDDNDGDGGGDDEEETFRSTKNAKAGSKRVRTTPQRKPKASLVRSSKRQNRSPYPEEGHLGLQLRCPHCSVLPIPDAAVDGAGNVACYECLRGYSGHHSPVTRLRRNMESTASGADSPFCDEGVDHQRASTTWIRQSDKHAAAGWGDDMSDSGGEHDQSPTSAIDRLLQAANAGSGGDQPTQVTAMGQTGVGQDDLAAAALLFPGVSVEQRQGPPVQSSVLSAVV